MEFFLEKFFGRKEKNCTENWQKSSLLTIFQRKKPEKLFIFQTTGKNGDLSNNFNFLSQ